MEIVLELGPCNTFLDVRAKGRSGWSRCIQCSIDWCMQYSHWVTESVVGRAERRRLLFRVWSTGLQTLFPPTIRRKLPLHQLGRTERLMPIALLSFTRFAAREETPRVTSYVSIARFAALHVSLSHRITKSTPHTYTPKVTHANRSFD